MFTKGEYRDNNGTYGVLMRHTSEETEILLIVSNTIESAFKHTLEADYSFLNTKAKEMYTIVKAGIAGCKPKLGNVMPFCLGSSMYYEFIKTNTSYNVETYNGEIVGMEVEPENDAYHLSLKYLAEESARGMFPQNIPYVKLTRAIKKISEDIVGDIDANEVQVRSVDEIRLEKDLTCFNNKKYYIVNDDAVAEQIFSALDNYNGVIAYDTETTGLRINCFGKINSKYQRDLIKYNEEHPDDKLRADRLVGIIFCVESDVSYYFPCFNRKFKNLYEEDTPTRRAVIDRIKVKYTIGELGNRQSEMADYIRNTPSSEWTPDIILMERVRHILETRHIAAHNGSFEWRVGWQYEIDTNLKDDTMILHQIMYKFRSTTSNRGEPSNLKYLARVELGLNQLELGDFFPEFKEDEGEVRNKAGGKKKKGSKIDFSYMDYEGTRIYAPTDGDVTYQLLLKYKLDLIKNHKEQEYIYNVEVLVSCAIAYMEFYGHRIDEAKIMAVRDQTKAEIACIESEIRQIINYANQEELDAYSNLKQKMREYTEADESGDKERRIKANEETVQAVECLRSTIDKNEEKAINLDSPSQVAELFYDILQIPLPGDKRSVAKKVIQPLVKAKNPDESPKYPAVRLYSQYKSKWTLVTKFFDNLPYFMYPGGYIFSSYGQISTATGRMSCRLPNAQQYPKSVTNIVIPRDGYVMMDADYSQIEYRVLVALSGEEHLAKVFEDPDSDYHTLMASLMYSVPYASVTSQMRSDAKSFNFGIPYGMGFRSLAILLRGNATDSSVDEAKEKYELYFKDQPKTRKFFDQVKEMAQVNRYTKTFWSRYRYYSFEDKDGNVDNAKKASALRQAGNAVIQGTAADIFKISVARNFMYIRENNLLGKLLIVNMIHDEQLFEVDAQVLNVQRVLRDIGKNMQFKVDGFPPLYIGAGVGPAWAKAKDKMAEIHPVLLDQLSAEADNTPLYREDPSIPVNPKDILEYFDMRVLEFRRDKVKKYLLDPSNYGKDMHPAIGNLLNLQFNYGHSKEEGLTDDELTMMCIDEFIKHNGIEGITSADFKAAKLVIDKEDEVEYEDDEDEEFLSGGSEDISNSYFSVVDESNVMYGSSVHDLIKVFGSFVSPERKICGINTLDMGYKKKDELVDFLCDHICEPETTGAMEVIFLQEGNILNRTGLYVSGITGSEVDTRIKLMTAVKT